ncbi:MAG: 2-amino-4-hydroxy-6-hydroxymethyldihydropteridine diphosphokinase [Actinomycetota bacterium]
MRAYLGLGANVGDTRETLSSVPNVLRSRSVIVTDASRLFVTTPVGGPPQPEYLNQALEISTVLSPRELLEACKAVEFAFGRDRATESRNGPRTLDIDVLAIEGTKIDEPDLRVPHPRLHERAFALVPLAEIAPDLQIGDLGTVTSLLVSLSDTSGVRVAV